MNLTRIRLGDPTYPALLRELPNPPPLLTTSGPLERRRAVAIVGSRKARPESEQFAYDLAFALGKAGIVVVSGGARGVDAAAHRGAMEAGGATWVVSPTGKDRLFPPQHRELFDAVAGSVESRMLWCFEDHQHQTRDTLRYRNGVLAALSETLVVVQAQLISGSRNAVGWAITLDRTVWAMTSLPSMLDFSGSLMEIEKERARPLVSIGQLFRFLELEDRLPAQLTLGKPSPDPIRGRASINRRPRKGPPAPPSTTSWTDAEKRVFSEVSTVARHIDEIDGRTGLPPGSAVTALLTLSLKDVVVEGPDGFFRRRTVT